MERETKSSSLSTFILIFLVAATTTTVTEAATFTCNSSATATCQSLVGYVPTNGTTLKDVKSLFQLHSLTSLLSINNLPLSTHPSYQLPLNSPLLIPFPCMCSNGTGVSDHTPNYTVKPTDSGLYDIATTKFDGFVTYQEIGMVNKLKDANVIDKWQKLWIPLPCSCDEVDGEKVVHLAHVVASGSSLEAIGNEFGVDEAVLMKLNGIDDPKTLKAGQILDVPLKTCSSSISSTSLDHNLLLPNNSYALTAENCIQCSCSSSSNYQLSCHPVQGLNKSECPVSKCGNLFIGNSTGSGCDATTCAYQGYTNSTGLSIMRDLIKQPACNEAPASQPTGGSPASQPTGGSPAGGSPGGISPPNGNSGRLRMNGYKIQILFLVQIVIFWFSLFGVI